MALGRHVCVATNRYFRVIPTVDVGNLSADRVLVKAASERAFELLMRSSR